MAGVAGVGTEAEAGATSGHSATGNDGGGSTAVDVTVWAAGVVFAVLAVVVVSREAKKELAKAVIGEEERGMPRKVVV